MFSTETGDIENVYRDGKATKDRFLFQKLYSNPGKRPEVLNTTYQFNYGGIQLPREVSKFNTHQPGLTQNNYVTPNIYQGTHVVQKADARTPTEIRKSVTVPGLTGLSNLGNTCYMNSILQCLSAVDSLKAYFLSEQFKKPLTSRQKKKIAAKYIEDKKLDKETPVTIKTTHLDKKCRNTVTYQLFLVIKAIWAKNRVVTPRAFKSLVGQLNRQFIGYGQQDSHELLNFVLDSIHEDIFSDEQKPKFCNVPDDVYVLVQLRKKCLAALKNPMLSDDQKKAAKTEYDTYRETHARANLIFKSYIFWKKHLMKQNSIITKLFTGLYCSEIKCTECKTIYPTFDPFTTFSLPIINKNNVTLKECIDNFSKSEVLNGTNKYDCAKCGKKTESLKTMYVWEPPEILIVHLKRFENNGTYIRKIDKFVDYPIDNLRLDGCYSPNNPHDITFNLFAVSQHFGSHHGGHYTASCKNSMNGKWYDCNDSTVRNIPDHNVKSKVVADSGYILFYAKNN